MSPGYDREGYDNTNMADGQDMDESERNRRLGDFLRLRRARINPETDGLGNARRRTTGLRREEVASLAGISTEWYIKLEQRRGASPSLATLNGIARALRLDQAERLHLLALAGRTVPSSACSASVPDTLRMIVKDMAQPTYLPNRCWDVVAWTQAAVDLLQADFAAMSVDDRNTLGWMLTDAGARYLFGEGWEDEARRMISLFRTTCDLYDDDRALLKQVARLKAQGAHFERWWRQHDIGAPRSGAKRLRHSVRGDLTVLFSTFQANDDLGLNLAAYMTVL
ncbi:helix-turn-helix transcriptional regulator [Sphingomonas sp. CROZ-RG-20F-R02-07]|uniref:helix-turn-helix transcriptional regulator n=1 Tax=Sphingomonas sp. CROZ-RG-20F-R02-07 TaxID=2914832 RepID=UPI001F5A9CD2|nr:helix-turn-helix transcriptional regulator [Sphingomonas sp. CROZ-RG-20F-R02-07]